MTKLQTETKKKSKAEIKKKINKLDKFNKN